MSLPHLPRSLHSCRLLLRKTLARANTPPFEGADFFAASFASWRRGGFPPELRLVVCFALAIRVALASASFLRANATDPAIFHARERNRRQRNALTKFGARKNQKVQTLQFLLTNQPSANRQIWLAPPTALRHAARSLASLQAPTCCIGERGALVAPRKLSPRRRPLAAFSIAQDASCSARELSAA